MSLNPSTRYLMDIFTYTCSKIESWHENTENKWKRGCQNSAITASIYLWTSRSLSVLYSSFLNHRIQIKLIKAKMVCLGFEPGPQDGRCRRIHWAGAAATPTLIYVIDCTFVYIPFEWSKNWEKKVNEIKQGTLFRL